MSNYWWMAAIEDGFAVGEGDVELAHVKDRRKALLMKNAPRMLELLKDLTNGGDPHAIADDARALIKELE